MLKAVAPRTLGVLLLFLTLLKANGQVKSAYEFHTVPSAINEYYLTSATPDPLGNDSLKVYFYILAYHDACIEMQVKGINYLSSHHIAKDSLLILELPALPSFNSDTILDLGICFKANVPIAVYQGTETKNSLSKIPSVNSSTLIGDVEVNVTDQEKSFFGPMGSFPFWAQTYFGSPFRGTTTIQSLEDSNYILVYHKSITVDLSFSGSRIINQANSFDTVLMHNAEFIILNTVYTQAGGWQNEHTARSLNSRKLKVTTFTQDNRITLSTDFNFTSTQSPLNGPAHGYVWEDQKEISPLDTLFFWPSLMGFQGSNISLMAKDDSTEVYINGQLHKLNKWERVDTSIASSVVLSSNKPIYAYATCWPSYFDGRPLTNSNGDQFTTTVSSFHDLISKARVPTISKDTLVQNIFSLVTRTIDTNSVLINGAALTNANWQAFSQNPTWSYINVPVNQGIHLIESSGGFQGYYYAFRPYSANLPTGMESGTFGHVIPEYSELSEDSLQLFFGLDPKQLWPIDSLKSRSLQLCPGDSLYFSQGAYRNTSWTFTFKGNTFQVEPLDNRVKAIVLQADGGGYLKISDRKNCFYLDSFRISTANIMWPQVETELFQSCSRTVFSLNLVNAGDAQYQWFVLDEKTQTGNRANYYVNPASDSLKLSLVASQDGCSDTLEMSFAIKPVSATSNFIMPNILTPNGDGINDELCFKGLELLTSCFEFTVSNRWGKLVYSSTSPEECWQPKNLNNGTYFYSLRIQGNSRRGFIVINDVSN